MNTRFYALRNDGLGERLCAIFNGLFLSKLHNTEFKLNWPTKGEAFNSTFHSVGILENIFSNEFITKFHIDENQIPIDITDYKESISENHHNISVPQSNSVISSLSLSGDTIKNIRENVINELDYSENIKKIFNHPSLYKFNTNTVAIHIRAGDIIYGKYSKSPNFHSKVIVAPLVVKLIEKEIEDKNVVYLFGQDKELIKNLNSIYGLDDVYNGFDINTTSPIENAMYDIFAMSRCKKIFAGSSGFARIASMLGGNKVLNPLSGSKKIDLSYEIRKELSSRRFSIYSPQQIGYSYYVAFRLSENTNDEDHHITCLKNACDACSDNPLFLLSLALAYIKYNCTTLALNTLNKAFGNNGNPLFSDGALSYVMKQKSRDGLPFWHPYLQQISKLKNQKKPEPYILLWHCETDAKAKRELEKEIPASMLDKYCLFGAKQ